VEKRDTRDTKDLKDGHPIIFWASLLSLVSLVSLKNPLLRGSDEAPHPPYTAGLNSFSGTSSRSRRVRKVPHSMRAEAIQKGRPKLRS
jgi:hypothetical protein